MNEYINQAIEKIETQQKGIENTAPWVVGEQLKDICRNEPHSAELLAQDLDVKDLSLTAAEKKIKAWADEHKTGNFSYVPPAKAEEILREFYGLEKAEQPEETGGAVCLNFEDFLR